MFENHFTLYTVKEKNEKNQRISTVKECKKPVTQPYTPTLLDLARDHGLQMLRVSTAGGGEWAGPCPLCGGTDRLRVWPDKVNTGGYGLTGQFWCRQCGTKGDALDWLQRVDRLSFRDACQRLGIAKSSTPRQHYRPAPTAPPATAPWTPRNYPPPSALWQEQAETLLAAAQERLFTERPALDWLARRGINEAAARRYGLGYHRSTKGGDSYRSREAWGLQPQTTAKGQPKRLWIPEGWLIPSRDTQGTLLQIRIRRPDHARARFAPDIRYLPVEGSSQATLVLHPEAQAFAVAESGLDAILLAACTGGTLGAVCTWSASARPDSRAHTLLSKACCILIALDYDTAGDHEAQWWMQHYRRAIRPPSFGAKDPGDAHAQGIDLLDWIRRALPHGLAMRLQLIPRQPSRTEPPANPQPPAAPIAPSAHSVGLYGRQIYLCDNQTEWQALADAHFPVFSATEVMHLAPLMHQMGATERAEATELLCDVKEIFGGHIQEVRHE